MADDLTSPAFEARKLLRASRCGMLRDGGGRWATVCLFGDAGLHARSFGVVVAVKSVGAYPAFAS